MTRGRRSNAAEARREVFEGDICLLGNLIVRAELVDVRLREGVKVAPSLLAPAVSEMAKIRGLAVKVQRRLRERMEGE